jgi:hypothetical protein
VFLFSGKSIETRSLDVKRKWAERGARNVETGTVEIVNKSMTIRDQKRTAGTYSNPGLS